MHRRTILPLMRLIPALGLLVFAGGCGDSPVAPKADIVLATFTQSINSTGTGGSGPTMPLTARPEFGVASDPPDPSSDYPIPLLFENEALTAVGQTIIDNFTTPDFKTVANRLTDGTDEGIYHQLLIDGWGGSGGGGSESNALAYASGVSRSGPDLAGYVVTSISLKLTELSATQSGTSWTVKASMTGTIRGHER
jgi:hypothetical protein